LQHLAILAVVKDAVNHVGIFGSFARAKGNKGRRYDVFKKRVTDFIVRLQVAVAAVVVLWKYLVLAATTEWISCPYGSDGYH
jgi:hypothetical protein